MPFFRKKPAVIEAMLFSSAEAEEVAAWCGGRIVHHGKASDPSDVWTGLKIPTLEGVMTANLGDWVIKGVKGEFYPCKPDIFAATYEDEFATKDGGAVHALVASQSINADLVTLVDFCDAVASVTYRNEPDHEAQQDICRAIWDAHDIAHTINSGDIHRRPWKNAHDTVMWADWLAGEQDTIVRMKALLERVMAATE